jgi:hypothetical protein
MNEEKTKKLIESFPLVFNSDFHFECDCGWYDLITSCAEKLTNVIKKLPNEMHGMFKTLQLKEKFGSMRWYICYPTEEYPEQRDDFLNIIREVESKSCFTCEYCGSPGKVQPVKPGAHWVMCLCENCIIIKNIIE